MFSPTPAGDETGIQQAEVALSSQSFFLPHRPLILAKGGTTPAESV